MPDERIISVEDHGMWRGHHSWTVRIDGPTGLAQVSARGDGEAAAISDAVATYRNRRVFTDEEREAMRCMNGALARALTTKGNP